MGKKKQKLKEKAALKKLRKSGVIVTDKAKNKCCDKYKKRGDKRCKKCPRFDELNKVA